MLGFFRSSYPVIFNDEPVSVPEGPYAHCVPHSKNPDTHYRMAVLFALPGFGALLIALASRLHFEKVAYVDQHEFFGGWLLRFVILSLKCMHLRTYFHTPINSG
jgi:hypothetical protein